MGQTLRASKALRLQMLQARRSPELTSFAETRRSPAGLQTSPGRTAENEAKKQDKDAGELSCTGPSTCDGAFTTWSPQPQGPDRNASCMLSPRSVSCQNGPLNDSNFEASMVLLRLVRCFASSQSYQRSSGVPSIRSCASGQSSSTSALRCRTLRDLGVLTSFRQHALPRAQPPAGYYRIENCRHL